MRQLYKAIINIAVALSATTAMINVAHADIYCPGGETVLMCGTKSKKLIQVCVKNGAYTYTYGKVDKPEMNLTRSYEQVINGDGMTLDFRKGNYLYSVYPGVAHTQKPAGVNVFKNGKKISNVKCKSYKSASDDIEDVYMSP